MRILQCIRPGDFVCHLAAEIEPFVASKHDYDRNQSRSQPSGSCLLNFQTVLCQKNYQHSGSDRKGNINEPAALQPHSHIHQAPKEPQKYPEPLPVGTEKLYDCQPECNHKPGCGDVLIHPKKEYIYRLTAAIGMHNKCNSCITDSDFRDHIDTHQKPQDSPHRQNWKKNSTEHITQALFSLGIQCSGQVEYDTQHAHGKYF